MDAVCYGFKLFGQINCSGDELSAALLQSQFKSLGLAESVGVKSIAFGWSRCYIIFEDGTVCFQGFFHSQTRNQGILKLPFHNFVKKITCMRRYDLFLTDDGSIWKYSLDKQWSKLDNLIPSTVKRTDFQIVDVISSDDLHLAVSDEGHMFSFPACIYAPLPAKVKRVSCGFEHYVCLLENGSVYTWGAGSRGQLGNGSLNATEQPELLIPLDGLIVVDVDAGGWHSAAVTTIGDLYTWGWNNFGQLGLASGENTSNESEEPCVTVISEPKLISYLDDSDISFKRVDCGSNHTLVLTNDGSVWGCGSNKYGQVNPISKEQCFYQMTRVPLPARTESVRDISCACWNSIIFISCKD